MDQVYDAAVIGAGVNGCGTALHLARLDKSVILIEQFPIPHSRGSSGGQTRVIRCTNHGNESMSRIMINSFNKWKQLEQETGESLLRPWNLFTITATADQKMNNMLNASIIQADKQPVWHSAKDFNENYSTSFASDCQVMEEADAGILMADKCLLAIQKRFIELGGKLLDEWPVENLLVADMGKMVIIGGRNGEIIKARSLVVCAGPWSKKILNPLGIYPPLRPTRIEVFYWRLKDPSMKTFSFVNLNPRFEHLYGLPAIEYPNLIKICVHDGDECCPDNRDAGCDSSDAKNKLFDFINSNFPWIHPDPVIQEKCMYTITPDREMIIDYHPLYKNIAYGCGFSGTGFKSGLVVGQILAEMVQGLPLSYDVSQFTSHRFDNVTKVSKL